MWLETAKKYIDIGGIGIDPTKSALLQNEINNTEYKELLKKIRQGTGLTRAIDQMENDIMRYRVSATNFNLLKWNIESAIIKNTGETYYLSKNQDSGNKIDSLIALASAYTAFFVDLDKGVVAF